jgi:hypothetical protein
MSERGAAAWAGKRGVEISAMKYSSKMPNWGIVDFLEDCWKYLFFPL